MTKERDNYKAMLDSMVENGTMSMLDRPTSPQYRPPHPLQPLTLLMPRCMFLTESLSFDFRLDTSRFFDMTYATSGANM